MEFNKKNMELKVDKEGEYFFAWGMGEFSRGVLLVIFIREAALCEPNLR